MGICKKKLSEGSTVIFIDESGYSLKPSVSRTWALKGTVPDIYHSGGGWQKLSVISGIAVRVEYPKLNTKLFFRTYPGQTIAHSEVAAFLRQISNQIIGHIIIVLDNLKSHRSHEVKEFVKRIGRMDLEYLPPYSPDMNPDEGVWNWSKSIDLVNVCSKNARAMLKNVRGSLRRLQHRTNVQRWCLNESILDFDSLYNLCGGV